VKEKIDILPESLEMFSVLSSEIINRVQPTEDDAESLAVKA
jgi:hypothetical protein